jgi:hypothetical protein
MPGTFYTRTKRQDESLRKLIFPQRERFLKVNFFLKFPASESVGRLERVSRQEAQGRAGSLPATGLNSCPLVRPAQRSSTRLPRHCISPRRWCPPPLCRVEGQDQQAAHHARTQGLCCAHEEQGQGQTAHDGVHGACWPAPGCYSRQA